MRRFFVFVETNGFDERFNFRFARKAKLFREGGRRGRGWQEIRRKGATDFVA